MRGPLASSGSFQLPRASTTTHCPLDPKDIHSLYFFTALGNSSPHSAQLQSEYARGVGSSAWPTKMGVAPLGRVGRNLSKGLGELGAQRLGRKKKVTRRYSTETVQFQHCCVSWPLPPLSFLPSPPPAPSPTPTSSLRQPHPLTPPIRGAAATPSGRVFQASARPGQS